MNLRQISRKVLIVRIIISAVVILILIGIGIYFWIWSMTQHHFNEAPKYMLCDLTGEEQADVLDAFGLTIPGNEKNAYVYSFSYGKVDERLFGYDIEIAGVQDYEGFYKANPENRSFNETTREFRTDRAYYIVYKGSVDTLMEKWMHEKYSDLYSKIYDRQNKK